MRDNENYWNRLRSRPLSRRRFLVGSGVAAAGSAAILAGCGDDDDDDDGAAAPAATAAATEAAAAEATEAAADEAAAEATAAAATEAAAAADADDAKRGGTLRLWKAGEDAGLDPGIYHINNTEVIYSTMTQPYTYQPTKNVFAMDGMVGYEQVDPTTLVWSIRPDMKFHNGDPVNSEAVAFSFGRLTKLYDLINPHTTRTGFVFVDDFEATDELTVTEHWSRPNADATVYRARHYYSFVNPRIVEEQGSLEGEWTAPDGSTENVNSVQTLPEGSGSGPYKLVRRDATGTRTERWPDYHKHTPADDGFVEDGPYIDAWETRIIPDRGSAKAAFLAGDLDVYAAIDPLELPEFEGVDHANVVELPAGGAAFLGMDGGKFHDKRARQALQKSLDYERIIRTIWTAGGKLAAPISDLIAAYQKLSQEELADWYRWDPQEARALWEAADFAVPVEKIKLFGAVEDPLLSDVTQLYAGMIQEALGIETEVELVDQNTWAARATDVSTDVKDWELLSYGNGSAGGTTGVPNDTHLIHFDPRGYGLNAFNHWAGSPRPDLAADSEVLVGMLAAQEAETDPEARAELLTDVQRWILDNHYCNWRMPISSVSYYGFNKRLQDFGQDDWLNFYDRRRESMWINEA